MQLQSEKRRQMKKYNTQFFNVVAGADGTATILLYGDVGEGDAVDSGRVVAELTQVTGRYDRINVRINSRGGDVFAGMAIYNALRQAEGNITIYVDGMAASIAAVIALCGKPLMMSPYARLMLHQVSGGGYGGADWLRAVADQIDLIENDLASMLARRLGITSQEVKTRYFDGKDHWLTAAEAVNMGIADGIYDMPDSADLSQRTDEEIYTYFNNRLHGATNNDDMALIDDIKALPTFEDKADASAVVAHIKELENQSAQAEALRQANEQYKNKIAEMERKEVDTFLDKAVADGKITSEQLPSMKKLMAADRETATKLIDSMKPQKRQPRAAEVFDEDKTTSMENKTWDELDRSNQLAALKAHSPEIFAQKYEEKFGVKYKA